MLGAQQNIGRMTRAGEPRHPLLGADIGHRRSKPPRQSLRFAYRTRPATLESDVARDAASAEGENPGHGLSSPPAVKLSGP